MHGIMNSTTDTYMGRWSTYCVVRERGTRDKGQDKQRHSVICPDTYLHGTPSQAKPCVLGRIFNGVIIHITFHENVVRIRHA